MKLPSMNYNYNNKLIGNKEFNLKNIALKLLYIIIIISLSFISKNKLLFFFSNNRNITDFLSLSRNNIS